MNKNVMLRWATAVVPAVVVFALMAPSALTKERLTDSLPMKALSVMNIDQAKKVEFPWGWIRWLMDSKIDKKAEMTFGIVQIDAGKDNPMHSHPNCEECLYVLSGSCEHVVGDKTVVLKQGDVIRIPRNVPHKAKSLGKEPCKAVIAYNTGARQVTMLEKDGKE